MTATDEVQAVRGKHQQSIALNIEPTTSPEVMRAMWREHFDTCSREAARYAAESRAYIESGGCTAYPRPARYPPFPDALRGLQCGARTRLGQPCKRRDLGSSGRCKFHGGFSTGPKTDEGRRRSLANLAKRWDRKS